MDASKNLFFNDKWKDIIKNGSQKLGIDLDNSQIDLFSSHAAHLYLWNKTINLTAIKDPEEMALKHFIDSIALILHINKDSKILDIGSGGGFPGFCLKIIYPDLDIVLIDSAKKKVNFLKDLIRKTSLKKIEAMHVRAEDLCNDLLFYGQFDYVVSRAFSSLEKFYLLATPFLNEKGVILAMKGQVPNEEIKQLKSMNKFNASNMIIESHSYKLPFTDIERSIVKIS